MRSSITLPGRLFQEAEVLAARLGIPRSQLYSTAIEEYIRAHRRDGITESLNFVYAKVDQTPDDFLEALQRATLLRYPW